MSALRHNADKVPLDELDKFEHALDAVVRVMMQGAKKYATDNWLKGGKEDREYLGCARRHIRKATLGAYYPDRHSKHDPELGVLHAAEAVWNLLAYMRLNLTAEQCGIQPNELDNNLGVTCRPGEWMALKPGELRKWIDADTPADHLDGGSPP